MKIVWSLVTSYVVMFMLGGLWNAVILESFYISHSPSILRPAEDFNLPIIALGYLIIASLMGLIVFQNFKIKPSTIVSFGFGATFGISITLPLYLILWGRWDFSLTYVLVDSFWHIIEQGIGGVVLCSMYFRGKTASD